MDMPTGHLVRSTANMGLKKYRVFRLHPAVDPLPALWIGHGHWDETPEGLRDPLTWEGALDLIKWARVTGERYCVRSTNVEVHDHFEQGQPNSAE